MHGGGAQCKAASEMEEGPPAKTDQADLSNGPVLLQSKAAVSERQEKGCPSSHVSHMKMNENEPSVRYR